MWRKEEDDDDDDEARLFAILYTTLFRQKSCIFYRAGHAIRWSLPSAGGGERLSDSGLGDGKEVRSMRSTVDRCGSLSRRCGIIHARLPVTGLSPSRVHARRTTIIRFACVVVVTTLTLARHIPYIHRSSQDGRSDLS